MCGLVAYGHSGGRSYFAFALPANSRQNSSSGKWNGAPVLFAAQRGERWMTRPKVLKRATEAKQVDAAVL